MDYVKTRVSTHAQLFARKRHLRHLNDVAEREATIKNLEEQEQMDDSDQLDWVAATELLKDARYQQAYLATYQNPRP